LVVSVRAALALVSMSAALPACGTSYVPPCKIAAPKLLIPSPTRQAGAIPSFEGRLMFAPTADGGGWATWGENASFKAGAVTPQTVAAAKVSSAGEVGPVAKAFPSYGFFEFAFDGTRFLTLTTTRSAGGGVFTGTTNLSRVQLLARVIEPGAVADGPPKSRILDCRCEFISAEMTALDSGFLIIATEFPSMRGHVLELDTAGTVTSSTGLGPPIAGSDCALGRATIDGPHLELNQVSCAALVDQQLKPIEGPVDLTPLVATATRPTLSLLPDLVSHWSPSGTTLDVAYVGWGVAPTDLYFVRVDPSGQVEVPADRISDASPMAIASDGEVSVVAAAQISTSSAASQIDEVLVLIDRTGHKAGGDMPLVSLPAIGNPLLGDSPSTLLTSSGKGQFSAFFNAEDGLSWSEVSCAP
jgi:hypothetical protein